MGRRARPAHLAPMPAADAGMGQPPRLVADLRVWWHPNRRRAMARPQLAPGGSAAAVNTAVVIITNALLDFVLFRYLLRRLVRLDDSLTDNRELLAQLCSRQAHIACLDSIFGPELNGTKLVYTCTRPAGHHGRHRNDEGREWDSE